MLFNACNYFIIMPGSSIVMVKLIVNIVVSSNHSLWPYSKYTSISAVHKYVRILQNAERISYCKKDGGRGGEEGGGEERPKMDEK